MKKIIIGLVIVELILMTGCAKVMDTFMGTKDIPATTVNGNSNKISINNGGTSTDTTTTTVTTPAN